VLNEQENLRCKVYLNPLGERSVLVELPAALERRIGIAEDEFARRRKSFKMNATCNLQRED
jgi:hypothetical protein